MLSPDIISQIEPLLEEIEQKKIDQKRKNKKRWLYFLLLVVLSYAMVYLLSAKVYYIWVSFLVIFLTVVLLIVNYSANQKIVDSFKTNVLVPVIKKVYPELTYSKHAYISKEDFFNSGLYSKIIHRYQGEDLFKGVRHKTAYSFSEIHAEEKYTTTDGKGNTQTHYRTVFKGVFMVADFNKELQYHTRVVEGNDNFFEKLFAGKSKVSLEDPTFEKVFNTYSGDQVEARYILTPAMMERILELKRVWNSKIGVSFHKDHIYIAIESTKNLFEPNRKQTFDVKQLDRILEEIESCLSVIDTLDLNTRIWTKN